MIVNSIAYVRDPAPIGVVTPCRFTAIIAGRFCRKLCVARCLGYDRWKRVQRNSTMIEFKGSHFEREVILWGVRWYVAYPISYRQLEEMMEERGVEVDHSTLNRWVVKYVPLLDQQFRARKRPVGSSWRLDETYVKVKGAGSICIGPSIRRAARWTSC